AFVGGVVVPGLVMTVLALAPFVDRSPRRDLRARLFPIGAFVVALGAMAALTSVAVVNDARDPKIQSQEEAARRFMEEPFEPDRIGFKPEPAAAAAAPPPEAFATNCAGCHGAAAGGNI